MKKCIHTLFYLLLYIHPAFARYIWPAENALLNYRLIGFSFTDTPGAYKYRLEMAPGYINNTDSFIQSPIVQQNASDTQVLAIVPSFGQVYTWRVSYFMPGGVITYSVLHHFTTGIMPCVDSSRQRLRVTDTCTYCDKGLYLFVDANRTLYNIDGAPLWYLPATPGLPDISTPVRDLKVSPFHTITFIANTQAYEIDYNGHILWQAPDDGRVNGDTTENYHHEFSRLHNGHYMIAGNQFIRRYLPAEFTKKYWENENVRQRGDKYYVDVPYTTLMEYDSTKNIVWSWKSSQYFTDKDLMRPALFEDSHVPEFHHNAFCFDEKNHVIYNSFRDINCIWKISYPNGHLLASYSKDGNGTPLFKGQHNCNIDKDGNLLLFDNNFSMNNKRGNNRASSWVKKFKEPIIANQPPTLLWSFDCHTDNNTAAQAKGGGSASELTNGDILVCMGTVNRVFIIHKNSITWQAFTEYNNEGRWLGRSGYRVSAIEGNESLKKLIFNAK